MPAAVRGAGRSSVAARGKSPASPQSARARQPAARPQSHPPAAISPKWIAVGVVAALTGALIVAAATGHRAERFAAAAEAGLVQRSAALGFRLNDVKLQGASPQSSSDILRAAALTSGVPLAALDLDAARQRIEQVGWVKSVRVVRLWPSSVLIDVDERQLQAVWQNGGKLAVIDASGVAAPEADPAKFAGLPLVVGDGANTAAAAILPSIASRPRLAQRLDALVRVDDRRWDLRLKDGCIIQLPASDAESALMRLDQLDQQSRVLDLGFARIDLRDPEMVTVRPRQNAAAQTVSDGA
ncbi:MAG TPA: cell division protein FtsQ/DivIB [Caulobacteraceae bacterium]|jgi:cell division protein FtsQ